VLVVVLRGSAVVRAGGVEVGRAAGQGMIVERGAARQLVAGAEGATVLTVHRRREGLQIQNRRSTGTDS
jgi:hypothetical protein